MILVVLLVGIAVWTLSIEQTPPPPAVQVRDQPLPASSAMTSVQSDQNRVADIATYSVQGVPVGMTSVQLYSRLGAKEHGQDPQLLLVQSREPTNGNVVVNSDSGWSATIWHANDLVYIVTGNSLEQQGESILKAGDTLEQAIARLGPYANKPGGLYFDYGPVTVQVHPSEDRRIEKFTLYYDEFLSHKK